MSENRELTMDDYLAMLRRRLNVILIPALLAPLVGYLVSYVFPSKFTSTSTVLVEGQKVPENYVAPVITSDFSERVSDLQERVIGSKKLRDMIEAPTHETPPKLPLVRPEEEDAIILNIQQNMRVEPVITTMSLAVANSPAAKKKPSASNEPVPGFNVAYTDSDAIRAQRICNALTSLIVTENLKERGEIAKSTTDFLDRQLKEAKSEIDQNDEELANFKKRYMGQLPTDVDNNMRMLMSLNLQLDTATQTLARARQDNAYAENMLAEQIAAWKGSQSSTNLQTLEQELSQLQAQLLQLQARYTADHPDVIKTQADIAEVQNKMKQINAATGTTGGSDKANSAEPLEIKQLRLQVHQYHDVIGQTTLDQKRLQSQINVYQSRTAMSPNVEEQYKALTRGYDNAQAFYRDLLAKKSAAELGTSMETAQQGEQMSILAQASLPDDPSFPNRPMFAAGGLGAGLALGLLITIWLEFSDKSIRTEKDAAAVMDLPLLISVPWLGEDDDHATANGNGTRRFWGRRRHPSPKEHEHVEV
ncbi:MAG TPA: hypothetical protein VIX14_00470 [Terriglobales bacterium]